MALPKPSILLRSAVRRTVSLANRLAFGYGRHDAELFGRFVVPIHRTDAELRAACFCKAGAR